MSQGFTQQDVDAFYARRAGGRKPLTPALSPCPAKGEGVKESEIQEQIAGYLRSFGNDCNFDVARMDKATTSRVGRPDFLGGLRGVGFAIEVKRPGCKETMEQAGELMRWRLCGFRSAVVHSLAEAVEFIVGEVLAAGTSDHRQQTTDRGGAERE